MALIKLSSSNPNFSYIIAKNPASGLLVNDVRQGHCFGFFDKNGSYIVWFRDSDTEVSYKYQENDPFEYINASRYNSAMFIVSATKEYFSSATKKQHEDDTSGTHTIEVNLVYIANKRFLEIFTHHFKDFSVSATEVTKNNYNLKVTTSRPIRDLLCYINVLAIMMVVHNDADMLYIDDGTITKYLDYANVIDAPYFIKYILKTGLLRSPKKFKDFKGKVEFSKNDKISMTYGNNAVARQDAALKFVTGQRQVVDIGCGEGSYVKKLASKMQDAGLMYMAVDIDQSCLDTVEAIASKRQLDNVVTAKTIDDLSGLEETSDVLMIEVIEHMPLEAAKELVKKVLQTVNFKTLIITTPNEDFNKYYDCDKGSDNMMRHDDHHFELNFEEFGNFIKEVAEGVNASIFGIGDQVNGVYTSTMAVLER